MRKEKLTNHVNEYQSKLNDLCAQIDFKVLEQITTTIIDAYKNENNPSSLRKRFALLNEAKRRTGVMASVVNRKMRDAVPVQCWISSTGSSTKSPPVYWPDRNIRSTRMAIGAKDTSHTAILAATTQSFFFDRGTGGNVLAISNSYASPFLRTRELPRHSH